MKKRIILIGCGEIGSRHLQALAKLSEPIDIEIIEPKENAIKIAKQRLKEIREHENHSYFWHNSIEQSKSQSDLIIISTTAKNRVNIICNLLKKGHKKFFIEKMVCQTISDYDLLMKEVKNKNAKCWVNLVRRYFPIYQEIKELIFDKNPTQISVIAGNNGLGTNAIHYLDLFTWLNNDNQISLDGTLLNNSIFPNKRGTNLVEFNGTIIGKAKNNSSINISFIPKSTSPIIINIKNKNNLIIYDEYNMKIFMKDSKIQESNFKYEHVSNTTTRIVEDIFKKDTCLLPNLEDLYTVHNKLLEIFTLHLNKVTGKSEKVCLIT